MLNETHALPVAKRNRVSVDHMVHAVDRWCARGFGTNRTEQGQNEADESCFHRSHRTGLVVHVPLVKLSRLHTEQDGPPGGGLASAGRRQNPPTRTAERFRGSSERCRARFR